MVLGPTSSAPVAVAWFGCLFAGGFWHARKQRPSELPATASASSVPVLVSENARSSLEGILEKPVISEQEVEMPEKLGNTEKQVKETLEEPVIRDQEIHEILEEPASSEQEVKEILDKPLNAEQGVKENLEKPAIRDQEVKEILEKPVNSEQEVKEILERPDITEQKVKEILGKPVISEQEDSQSYPSSVMLESEIDVIGAKSLELVDEAANNYTKESVGFDSKEPALFHFAIPEFDFTSFSVENVKQAVSKVVDNNIIYTGLINALGADSSPLVWAIVASWPIDLLLIFCMCGFCKKTKGTKRQHRNEDDTIDETAQTKNIVWLGENDVASQGEHLQDYQTHDHKEVLEEITLPNAETVQRSKRKSQQDLKALMERKRAECEVVENTQTLVSTDAKAPEQPKFKWQSSDEKENQSNSNGQTRAKCRNSSDLKALMEKKQDQCQVLESAQEHIETDAKASCHEEMLFKYHSSDEKENTRAKCRNSSDLKALMEKKRDQCQVLESAQEHIETDAKACCHEEML